MQHIDSYDFNGRKAIVRVDFNVPLDANFNITDDTRIRAAIPTLKKVLAGGGALIIMSHLGKPKGPADKFSLRHIIGRIEELLGTKVQFAPDCMKADEQAAALKPGEVLLLENLRFYAEEEGKPRGLAEDASEEEKKAAKAAVKESQKKFTEHLASYADCYINDAFGTAHRAHASTALIAKYFPNDKMFGYVMEGEIKAIDKVLDNPQRPLTVILGGAKVSSKIGVIEHLLGLADNMIVCGGMVFTFMKAQGGSIGKSLVEDDQLQLALDTIAKAREKGVRLYFSDTVVAADAFDNNARHPLERSRRSIRDAQFRTRHQRHRRDTCRGHRKRCLHPRGRRRLRSCCDPDGLCRQGELCVHRRRCDAGVPGGKRTSGYQSHPRITGRR